jgi:hypothetical protein
VNTSRWASSRCSRGARPAPFIWSAACRGRLTSTAGWLRLVVQDVPLGGLVAASGTPCACAVARAGAIHIHDAWSPRLRRSRGRGGAAEVRGGGCRAGHAGRPRVHPELTPESTQTCAGWGVTARNRRSCGHLSTTQLGVPS